MLFMHRLDIFSSLIDYVVRYEYETRQDWVLVISGSGAGIETEVKVLIMCHVLGSSSVFNGECAKARKHWES